MLFEERFTGNRRRTEIQNLKNQMESRNNNILYGIASISNIFSNSQVNDRPKRRIRSFRTLSKQAMKEYAIKKANSSGFEWFDDEEMER